MLLSDYILQTQELIHDTSSVDFTTAEMTKYVNGARRRISLDTHCVRQYLAGANLIAGQEQYPLSGAVVGDLNLVGGGGYTGAATVSIGAPPAAATHPNQTFFVAGSQATAVATVAGGIVTNVTMTNWGYGYTSAPTLTINPIGGGAGATALAQTSINVIDINTLGITWPGTKQSATLSWLPFSAFDAFCRANTLTQRNPSIWTTYEEMGTIFVFPIPDQAYTLKMDVITLSTDLVNQTDVDQQIFAPYDELVQYDAAYHALLKMQNFEHAAYFEAKYEKRVKQIILTRRATRTPNIYHTWYRRINRW